MKYRKTKKDDELMLVVFQDIAHSTFIEKDNH